ncbi:hypothetical protein GYMLUDRAFT_168714 [Collybiopsis luxurians FD-317 M1]|uniref:Periodic tryptophan protein 1 n=1 Tax=Collybiopsis luxurians FD-317 M1 TaxID=944289 RepID=A0A0D0CAZ1_9AGAR|nr:hypothetical protein GYMLUDRAFT_168714 [Collybiopsis luxurians FD-317 M1]
MSASLISSIIWVPRGVSQQNPSKYVLDDAELERVSALARIELADAKEELRKASEAAKKMGKADAVDEEEEEDIKVLEDSDAMDVDESSHPSSKKTTSKADDPEDLSKYNLDGYDDDEGADAISHFTNINNISHYKNNDEDPYITLKDDGLDEERSELEILPTDNLLVVAKTEDEISQLEIHVYEEAEENLYVHHDLMLPNFPLCLEWLDFPPAGPSTEGAPNPNDSSSFGFGSYIAVGTLDPEIEIWSLDVVEAMYPNAVLGRPDKTKAHVPVPLGTGKKKKKKTKVRETEDAYHVDAVLDLSWNCKQRNLLASASADKTVKLWDLSRSSDSTGALRSFNHHTGTVQAVQWNSFDPAVLLTGSYDRTVKTFDSRAPDGGVGVFLGAEVEALKWDPWEESAFYVSLENGLVLNFDIRTLPSSTSSSPSSTPQPSPARFTLQAHTGPCSALDVNPHVRGCVVTGGGDKVVKVWNVTQEDGNNSVSLVTSRDLGIGKVFAASFSPESSFPLTLAAGGSKAVMQIWDVGVNRDARRVFGSKLRNAGNGGGLEEKYKDKGDGAGVIGLASDGEESDEE